MPVSAIQYEEKADDPLMTASEYSRHAKKSPQAACRMVKRHGIRLDQNRKAPLSVWLEAERVGLAMDKNALTSAGAGLPKGSLSENLNREKLNKLQKENQLLELELAKSRGETVPLAEHRRRIQGICGLCMRLLDAALENWAAEVRDPDQFERLREGIDRAKRQVREEAGVGA